MAGIATSIGDLGGGTSGAGAGTGGDFDSVLGSALSDGFDAGAGESGDTPLGAEDGSSDPSLDLQGDTPQADAQTPPQDAQQPDQQAPPADAEPLPGWKLSPDGQTYAVPRTELPRVQSALNYTQAVSQFFSTPAEAQSAALQANDLRVMMNDWQYGTDESIRSVINHFAGQNHRDPQARQQLQQSFVRMAQMIPDQLKSINPAAHQQFVSTMGKSVVEGLYQKAAQSGNPQDLLDAQSVDWGLNGKYEKELPKADPAALAQKDLERRQQDFDKRQNAALQRDTTAFSQTALEGAKFQQLDQRIDKVLEAVKDRYSEVAYTDLKAGIQRELMDSLRQNDWFTEHKQHYDQLIADYGHSWRAGTPGNGLQSRAQAYITDFLARASRALPAIAAKRINATTARQNGTNGRPNTRQNAGNARPGSQTRGQNGQYAQNANGQADPNRRLSQDEWNAELAKAFQI